MNKVATNTEIRIFENEKFGQIRTLVIDGNVWFVGKEVAEVLGYKKSRNAIISHVDDEDRQHFLKPYFGALENIPNRGLTCINESGLYSLILSSKLPEAKKFKHWVTSEVLPSIRKHGAYMTESTIEDMLSNPDLVIGLATKLKAETAARKVEQEKNKKLERENKKVHKKLQAEKEVTENLTLTNKSLVKDANTWDNKSIINALMRSYAYRCLNDDFMFAYNILYKQLKYKYHIDLKQRKAHSKTNKALMDYLTEDEFPLIVQLAVAMCEEQGIKTGRVINQVNQGYCDTLM